MRLTTLLMLIPAVVIAAIIAVANRQLVTFSLDPLSAAYPAIAVNMPLYAVVYVAILLGVLLGWATAIFRRGRRRTVRIPPVGDHALPEPRTRPKTDVAKT